jgi:hypothetical protein
MKNRRDFLKGVLGISVGITAFSKLNASTGFTSARMMTDVDALTYCCYKCTLECPTFNATVNNDLEAKKKIAVKWTEQLGTPVTAEEVFCYGCKENGKPENKMLLRCTVRKCAKEKGLKSCAVCGDLEKCDKELWSKWPGLKGKVVKIQKELQG